MNISPGWLSTMKIPIHRGRDFRLEDVSPEAAIVNETFAKTFFPVRDPIGRTFERPANRYIRADGHGSIQDRRGHPRHP